MPPSRGRLKHFQSTVDHLPAVEMTDHFTRTSLSANITMLMAWPLGSRIGI